MSQVELNSGNIYDMRIDQMFKIKNSQKQTDPYNSQLYNKIFIQFLRIIIWSFYNSEFFQTKFF